MQAMRGDPEAPDCTNRPTHAVIWSKGHGVNASSWWCLDCGEFVEGQPPRRARKALP